MALKGIKVIEMAGLAPVPLCGMILADFGANVVRIDKPQASSLDTLDRGKRSLSINMKHEQSQKCLQRLIERSDVLLDPYRPGVMEKLGFSPESVMKINPRLIYGRLTGFGQTGTLTHAAGHDMNYLAMSGVLSYLGPKEKPCPPINFLGDFAGGSFTCAIGVLLALIERATTQKGQVIDSNMVEGSAYVSSMLFMNTMMRLGPRATNFLDGGYAFYNIYETADNKFITVGAIETQFYKELITRLGLDMEEFPQYGDQKVLKEKFEKVFSTKTQAEWTSIFENTDSCVFPVLTVEEAIEHPHNRGKSSFVKNPSNNEMEPRPAPRLESNADWTRKPSPSVGQHSSEVLKEFGFADEEINELLQCGCVWSPQNNTQSKL